MLDVLGYVLRFLETQVFGLGMGWLTIRTVTQETLRWRLTVALYLGLLGHWVEGGATLAAFGLGVGAGLLVWGLIQPKAKDEEKAEEVKKRK